MNVDFLSAAIGCGVTLVIEVVLIILYALASYFIGYKDRL